MVGHRETYQNTFTEKRETLINLFLLTRSPITCALAIVGCEQKSFPSFSYAARMLGQMGLLGLHIVVACFVFNIALINVI